MATGQWRSGLLYTWTVSDLAFRASSSMLISSSWQQAAQGPYPDRFPYDVETLQSRLDRDADSDGFVDWNLMSKGGEIASLLHMVSNNEVEFDFNVKDIPTLKYQNWRETYNTRALSEFWTIALSDRELMNQVTRRSSLVSRFEETRRCSTSLLCLLQAFTSVPDRPCGILVQRWSMRRSFPKRCNPFKMLVEMVSPDLNYR